MIKLQIVGYIGKDAATNTVNGKNVINFSVAHSEKYKDAQGVQKDKTIWVECAYWTDRTAILPYLKKGTLVYADGTPEVRNYTNKEGVPGSSLTMRISSVQLLGAKNEGQNDYNSDNNAGENINRQPGIEQGYNQPGNSSSSFEKNNNMMDDLPF